MIETDKIKWIITSSVDIDTFIGEYYDIAKEGQYNNSPLRNGEEALKKLLELITLPFTIIRETDHVDRAYSEGYYTYYSNKHILHKRFCERLSFFSGQINESDFITRKGQNKIRKNIVGSAVVQVEEGGVLGRTILDPQKIVFSKSQSSALFVRLSDYELDIRGVRVKIHAFPYRMQDREVTSCAEVTLLNLFEYYGHRYDEYRIIYTEELLSILQKNSYQRTTPTHGLTYEIVTRVLSEAGFYPRLYPGSVYQNCESNQKNILYYYVESGIPVGVALYDKTLENSAGHSVVCIGHGEKVMNPHRGIEIRSKEPQMEDDARNSKFYYYNSADFYSQFIVMDDNRMPYSLFNVNDLLYGANGDTEIDILVPLSKRMFLEATNAFSIAKKFIIESSKTSIDSFDYNTDFQIGTEENPLVLRLFLASSRNYKSFKMGLEGKHNCVKTHLFDFPLPRYIWVCECYTYDEYVSDNPKACGEIIIDATSSPHSFDDCILFVHYPGLIACRYPEQSTSDFYDRLGEVSIDDDTLFPGYNLNLTKID